MIQEGNIGLMKAVNKFEYAATTSSLRTPFVIFGVGCGAPQLCTCHQGRLVRRTARQPSGKDPNHGSDKEQGYVLNWFVKPEEALMLQTVSPLILKLSLFLMTAVATHLVMSFGQTLLHYKVAHHPIGGKLFRNHINFHHTHYADDHLVSRTYLGDEGNITPYFLIPIFLVGGCAYFLLPLNLFVVTVIASAASFYAHFF